jgi:hypothetical protein
MKLFLALLLTLAGCNTTPVPVEDAGVEAPDAGEPDAGQVDAGHKADACAATFGAAFTNAFGRADGTVVAVVPPAWQCPLPNGDHLVIQVSIDGGVQRLVVNLQSSFGDPNLRVRTITAPLPAPEYSEGWHPGLALDYPSLGLHSDGGWDALTLEQVATRVYDAVPLGAPLSVYATSSGGSLAASAHLVHRNGLQNDGAIIVDPMGAQPTWLLFHFANQTF